MFQIHERRFFLLRTRLPPSEPEHYDHLSAFSCTKFLFDRIVTDPPTAPISMSPLTSFASSGPGLVPGAVARSEAPAQNVATQVPTTHPDPVISPSILWPFSNCTTTAPSDIQSVGPVMTATQPLRRVLLRWMYLRYPRRTYVLSWLSRE